MEIFDFRWWVCLDGYRLEKTEPRFFPSGRPVPGGRSSFALTSASDRFRFYQPLKIPALYARFVEDFASSAEGMHEFCRLFGLPGGGRPDMAPLQEPPERESVLVDGLLNCQMRLRKALKLLRQGDASGLTKYWNSSHATAVIRTQLCAGPGGQLELALIPPDLIQAMWLQLAQDACRGTRLFRCQRCSTMFVVGTGTGRRSTAKWCSVYCRVEAHREKKARQ
jgi:hypothetical protein